MTTPYRGRAPRVNPEDAPIPVPRTQQINVRHLPAPPKSGDVQPSAGIIPTEGLHSITRWAGYFGVEERTVEKWVRKYKVPYIKAGQMHVWAEHFLPRLPLVTFPDTETTDESEA